MPLEFLCFSPGPAPRSELPTPCSPPGQAGSPWTLNLRAFIRKDHFPFHPQRRRVCFGAPPTRARTLAPCCVIGQVTSSLEPLAPHL